MGFRKGVTIDQHLDDHGRKGKGQQIFENKPEKSILDDGQVFVLRGTGKLRFRDGDKIYEVTGVEVDD